MVVICKEWWKNISLNIQTGNNNRIFFSVLMVNFDFSSKNLVSIFSHHMSVRENKYQQNYVIQTNFNVQIDCKLNYACVK